MFSSDLLEELKTIVKEDYGVVLSLEELNELGYTLVAYFSLLSDMDESDCSSDEEEDNRE